MADVKRLVLIVDDDPAVRDALQFALRLEGMEVGVHVDGDALLADPGLSEAACIVIDEKMPKLDAFALLDRIRLRCVSSSVIILTSYDTPALRSRAKAMGVRAVLEKPLLNNVLIESIRGLQSTPPVWHSLTTT